MHLSKQEIASVIGDQAADNIRVVVVKNITGVGSTIESPVMSGFRYNSFYSAGDFNGDGPAGLCLMLSI